MNKTESARVAIYVRVACDCAAIAGQLEAIEERLRDDGLHADPELQFIDNGCSGVALERAALRKLRQVAADGRMGRLYVASPDRLSRRIGELDLLMNEFQRCGVELRFVEQPRGA
jgi:DNA invertase Pin-like site-specific DNA recombinase